MGKFERAQNKPTPMQNPAPGLTRAIPYYLYWDRSALDAANPVFFLFGYHAVTLGLDETKRPINCTKIRQKELNA